MLNVFCFEPSPIYKDIFSLKSRRHFFFFFSFNAFLWKCKYLYCHCIYNCVKNIDLLCWVYKKINSFLSVAELFLWERVGNSLRRTFVEGVVGGRGGTCKTNSNKQGGEGSKTGSFEWTCFLNDPFSKLSLGNYVSL